MIKDYDGIIVRSGTTVTADVINAGDKLKLIGRAGNPLSSSLCALFSGGV